VTHCRQVMLEELQRRNFAPSTISSYLHAVEQFARHFKCRPDRLNQTHFRSYPMFQRAVNADPENAAYLDNLGRANFKIGRFDLAEEHPKEAVERSKERSAILEHLAEVYAVTGRRDEAHEMLTAAIARTDNAADRKRLVKRLERLK
jgi:tetratricopeptide (TPR) repeat protein